MRPLIPGVLGDDSDKAWEWFGSRDPYYGVFSASQYRRENLDAEKLDAFFRSGEAHVERVLRVASAHLGKLELDRCLDFGCGVGRLVVPFSRRFESVVGIDVSASMLAEARKNCDRFSVTNAAFFRSLDQAAGPFDLVHTYVVLQHIPVRRGESLIEQLVSKTAPGGFCFLHFTTTRTTVRWRRFGGWCRRNVKPLHYALNLAAGRPVGEAYMQVNEYDLNRIIVRLFGRGIRSVWLESENHGGPYSVCLAFRVP